MEIYSNTTRFALACNMSNKIIEPIQSRCAILRYAKLSDLEVLKRLIEVCEAEKVRVSLCVMGTRGLHPLHPGRHHRRRPPVAHLHFGGRHATGAQQPPVDALRVWHHHD